MFGILRKYLDCKNEKSTCDIKGSVKFIVIIM